MLELQRRAAALHAQFAADTIAKLSCPKEQKMALLHAIIKPPGANDSAGHHGGVSHQVRR
ncbi:MAG: hypothetical protein FWC27_04075 [Firmicutes bacterium]|nr:hypothetical protein [Bacillota bacterium]